MESKNRAVLRTSHVAGGVGAGCTELAPPSADELQVEVEYCGLCGSDLHIWRGDNGYEWVPVGRTLGHEIVGVVVQVGADTDRAMIGQRVALIAQSGCGDCAYCLADNANGCVEKRTLGLSRDGGAAARLNVPARQALLVPATIPARTAVLTEPLSVAVRAATRGDVGEHDVVAVSGPGTIGLLNGLVCRYLGAEVYLVGTAADLETRASLARRLGLNLVEELPQDVEPKIWIEAAGAAPALTRAVEALPVGGTLVIVALYGEMPQWDLNVAIRKELDVRTSYSSHRPDYQLALRILATEPSLGEFFVELHELDDFAVAFERIGRGEAPKIALTPNPNLAAPLAAEASR